MAWIIVHVFIGFKKIFSIGIINGCGPKHYCGISYRLQCCLLWLLYKDTKAVVIEYFWAYGLLFGSQQEICKGSNSLNCNVEKWILLNCGGLNRDMIDCLFWFIFIWTISILCPYHSTTFRSLYPPHNPNFILTTHYIPLIISISFWHPCSVK